MFSYILKNKFKIISGGFLILLLSLLILPTPLITRRIIDKSIPNQNIQELLLLIGLAFGLLLVTKFLSYAKTMLFAKLNSKIIIDIKHDLMRKISQISKSEKEQLENGYLIARINQDTQRLRSLFADTFANILTDVLKFLVGVTAIFLIHWKLALVTVILLPFFLLTTIYFSKIIKKYSRQYFEQNAEMTQSLNQSLSLNELCSLFLRRKFSILNFYSSMKTEFRSYISLTRVNALHGLLAGFLTGMAPMIVIGYGGFEIINGRMTLGSLIAFNSFVGYLFGPTSRLVNVNVQIQQALVALKRVQELFDLEEEPIDREFQIPKEIKKLEFEKISFSYLKDKPILKDFSARMNFGEKIGIVGGSGSGKTTFLNLLTGLYKIDSGKIHLNDIEMNQAKMVTLRKVIAVVEQEPVLFNGTIYENIRFGNKRAMKSEIIQAAKNANAHDFIKDLDEGLETIVKHKGSNLSVGQKQRIAIARALMRKPKILILDEATSNIDTLSEKKISEAIENLPKDMIVIIVAHRLSTIRNCDRILVMENGKIAESGNHLNLLEQNGSYTKMFR